MEEVIFPYFFQWDIQNPFLPLQKWEATFYSRFPNVLQWSVFLQPSTRHINYWIFSFSLKCKTLNEDIEKILALLLQVDISVNGRTFARKEESNFFFHRGNLHMYDFDARISRRPKMVPPHLSIKITIHLLGPRCQNFTGCTLSTEDQAQLSEDLKRLLIDDSSSNMKLKVGSNWGPEEWGETFPVHSYIIGARWDNFFRIHPVDANFDPSQPPIPIDIPRDLLLELLIYIYSGELNNFWTWEMLIIFLFGVIDRYHLYHLYQVFINNDQEQMQEYRRHLSIHRCMFELDNAEGQILEDPSYTREFPADFNLTFQIKFHLDELHPSFSYSLTLRSGHHLHIRVNLEFVKEITRGGRRTKRVRPVHEHDYYVALNETKESEEVHFVDDYFGIFRDFHSNPRRFQRLQIRHSMQCLLYLTDGSTVKCVRNISDNSVQSERERFRVLGNHMHELLRQQVDSDLGIECLVSPENPLEIVYYVHEAIIKARVPEYWRVLHKVQQEYEFPRMVKCRLRSVAFHHVLLYIYTGKIFSFPLPFLDEIRDFADQSQFAALRNLVNRIRPDEINQ